MEFEGRVAIVTGGASGIGRASAEAFAERGAAVMVADLDPQGGAETVERICALGGKAAFVHTDVTYAEAVEAMVAATVEAFGGLDFAFNNAGFDQARGTVVDLPVEAFDKTISVNLRAVFLCMKYQIPAMRARGGGAIVNTSSGLGLFALPQTTAYVASKHAVIGLSKAAAVDFGPENIRVNILAPGKTETPMLMASAARAGIDMAQTCGTMPLRRIGKAEEQAQAVIWLCSPKSSFVTGMTMIVDGGSSVIRA